MNSEQKAYFMTGYFLSVIGIAIGILKLNLTIILLGIILNFVAQIYLRLMIATKNNRWRRIC